MMAHLIGIPTITRGHRASPRSLTQRFLAALAAFGLLAGTAPLHAEREAPLPPASSTRGGGLLFPQQNAHRNLLDLSGLWQFQLDPEAEGEANGWFNTLPAPRYIAVPCSWNDLFDDAKTIWISRGTAQNSASLPAGAGSAYFSAWDRQTTPPPSG